MLLCWGIYIFHEISSCVRTFLSLYLNLSASASECQFDRYRAKQLYLQASWRWVRGHYDWWHKIIYEEQCLKAWFYYFIRKALQSHSFESLPFPLAHFQIHSSHPCMVTSHPPESSWLVQSRFVSLRACVCVSVLEARMAVSLDHWLTSVTIFLPRHGSLANARYLGSLNAEKRNGKLGLISLVSPIDHNQTAARHLFHISLHMQWNAS